MSRADAMTAADAAESATRRLHGTVTQVTAFQGRKLPLQPGRHGRERPPPRAEPAAIARFVGDAKIVRNCAPDAGWYRRYWRTAEQALPGEIW